MNFTYVLNDNHDPRRNLALEESLFLKAQSDKEGFLMLWSNDPTVVVGRFQNTAEEVNRKFTQERNVFVVRRITGGGAVYHDRGNLNYTVILPTEDAATLDIHSFSIPLLGYLASLGVRAERTGRNDVPLEGRKFSGVAQHSGGGVVLHHGTILFDSRLEDVVDSLRVDPEKFQSKGLKSVRSRVTNLLPCLKNPVAMEEFQSGFADELISFYRAETVRTPSNDEAEKAEELFAQKYSRWDWNWGASPEFDFTDKRRFPGGTVQFCLSVMDGVVENCRFYGDFFSYLGTEKVELLLQGRPYPFEGLEKILPDELLKGSFIGVAPSQLRAFLSE